MLHINFSEFPLLETDRLQLSRLDSSHCNELFEMRANPDVMKYIPRSPAQKLEEVLDFIAMTDIMISKNEIINWAIILKHTSQFIGTIGFYHIKPEHYRAEIGYMLLPNFQGFGYISEAIVKVLRYGFDKMLLHSIEAVIDPHNVKSAKVLNKCGFVKEGHLKESEFFEGKFLDTVIYSRLNR